MTKRIFLTSHEDKKVQKLLEALAKKKVGSERNSAGTEARLWLATRHQAATDGGFRRAIFLLPSMRMDRAPASFTASMEPNWELLQKGPTGA